MNRYTAPMRTTTTIDNDQTAVVTVLSSVYNLITQPELSYLIRLLQSRQIYANRYFKYWNMATYYEERDEDIVRAVQEKCVQLKQKNQILLRIILNLKYTIARAMKNSRGNNIMLQGKYDEMLTKITASRTYLKRKIDTARQAVKYQERISTMVYSPIPEELNGSVLLVLKEATYSLQREMLELKKYTHVAAKYCNVEYSNNY